jgi:sugar lactone lactonase YvrE
MVALGGNMDIHLIGDIINDIKLDGDKIWVTTAGSGLYKIDTIQRTLTPTSSALHSQMDGMHIDDDGTMYVGLMGESGTFCRIPIVQH